MARSVQKWAFPARFRAGAYSWKASRLACQRLREAVTEIKKVTKKDPLIGAEGAVRLMEKIWPALKHVDSSIGALGSAVNKALDALIPILVNAPADKAFFVYGFAKNVRANVSTDELKALRH